MLLNNTQVTDRNNRPVVLSKVGLQAHFLVDGQYTDPYQISAVTIFPKSANYYPSSLLASSTQLIDESVSGYALMNFANSATRTTSRAFDVSNYVPGVNASGIYRLDTGKYIVVLDGTQNVLSGVLNLFGVNKVIANSASATNDYLDIWTIKMVEGSELQVVINDFTLRKGGFTVLTEPLMLKTANKLVNSKITLGSIIDLKIATNVYVENTKVDDSIKNLFRDTVVTNASVEILKLNDAANLPARVVVSSFDNTLSSTQVTADNVVIFNWDTTKLSTHPQLIAGNFGSIQGIYSIRTKYKVFSETIVSDPMYLTLS